VFAGAAREAVFSNSDVIRRVNADFVPVALKAGLVNNPPADEEGVLYREIVRSKPAPQGICVVNPAGKVLDWALMFDDDKSVLAFLDHSLRRYGQFPDAKKPFAAERYMKFPSQKLADVEDSGKVPAVPEHHAEGKACPAKPRLQRGTLDVRLFGRSLDADGKLVANTLPQENYVEDRFEVTVAMQQALAKAQSAAGGQRFRLADDLARLLVSHAFLGQLDVNPLGGVPGGKGALKDCEFWAQADAGRLHIEGKSEAAGASTDGGDGRLWQHEVKLTWEGTIELKDDRISRLLLVARGSERLKWGNQAGGLKGKADVTILPGGHAIDLRCGVRYGVSGVPVAAEQATDDAPQPAGPLANEARKQLAQALGGPFIAFRDQVQEELKLSDEQKRKLADKFPEYAQETMKAFDKVKDLKPPERDKEMHEHRRRAEGKLTALLKDVLDAKQQGRLLQLQLQQAGTFALLGQHEAFAKLKISDEQRRQFMEVVQEMEKKIQAEIQQIQDGAKPEDVFPKIKKVRKEHETKIETLLTEAQKKQWQELLGKPLDLED
jgi:hypothetical protein